MQHWVFLICNLAGEIYISSNCGIGYGTTLRGEHQPIRIGQSTTIGDNVMIHTFSSLGIGVPSSTNIGKNVVVGSGCYLCSCIIDDDCVIGSNSCVMEGAKLERGCVIAPASVVPPGRLIPAGQLWGGSPASFIKNLDDNKMIENHSQSYKYIEQSSAHARQIADPINELELEDSKCIGRYPDTLTKELEAIKASKDVQQ